MPPVATAAPADVVRQAAALLKGAKNVLILAGRASRDEQAWNARVQLAAAARVRSHLGSTKYESLAPVRTPKFGSVRATKAWSYACAATLSTLIVQSPCSGTTPGAAVVGLTASNHIVSLPDETRAYTPVTSGGVAPGDGGGPAINGATTPLGDLSVTVTGPACAVFIHISAKHSTELSGGSRQVHSTVSGWLVWLVYATWPSVR